MIFPDDYKIELKNPVFYIEYRLKFVISLQVFFYDTFLVNLFLYVWDYIKNIYTEEHRLKEDK